MKLKKKKRRFPQRWGLLRAELPQVLWELNEEPGPSWEGMGPALQGRKSVGSRGLQPRGCVMPPSSPTFVGFFASWALAP